MQRGGGRMADAAAKEAEEAAKKEKELCGAAQNGKAEDVQRLLDEKADVNLIDGGGNTALRRTAGAAAVRRVVAMQSKQASSN